MSWGAVWPRPACSMTPWPLAIAVAAPVSGRLADRFSPGSARGHRPCHPCWRLGSSGRAAERSVDHGHRLEADSLRPGIWFVPVAEQQGHHHQCAAGAQRWCERHAIFGPAARSVPGSGIGRGSVRPGTQQRDGNRLVVRCGPVGDRMCDEQPADAQGRRAKRTVRRGRGGGGVKQKSTTEESQSAPVMTLPT